jgi:hypothetical protein
MSGKQPLDEWHFDFGLGNQDSGGLIPYEDAEDLFKFITKWAEERGYGIGGGFGEFTEDEKAPLPLRPE